MTKETISPRYLLLSGVLLGSGIGLMHYTGMAAMRLNATMVHDSGLFYLSIIAAVALATVALTLQGEGSDKETLFFSIKDNFLVP